MKPLLVVLQASSAVDPVAVGCWNVREARDLSYVGCLFELHFMCSVASWHASAPRHASYVGIVLCDWVLDGRPRFGCLSAVGYVR